MGYKAAVQVLKEAEALKNKVLKKTDLLVDTQAWTDQQKLLSVYRQVLILDLEYALDKKVEQDLWNIGFKNHISVLQEMTRDKKNARRSECQALLTWCLEASSGFYITLLHELCNTFDLDLPFRRRGSVYGQNIPPTDLPLPQTSSCLYICQYCLVHLGDIARYRNQRRQAESFYKQAIQVSPTSGHPYNQLALLEASQGDKLSTVFYYIRAIAVKNPFPAATTNLLNTLNSALDKESPLEKVQTKLTVNEFIQLFLGTHSYLLSHTDLEQAEVGVKSLNTTMTALVATQSFTTDQLIKITAINLYALDHVTEPTEQTEDEKLVRQYVLELLAGSLSAFLVPIHTLKCDDSILDYYALPAMKLLTYWIINEPMVLREGVFINKMQIWPSLCKLLNSVQAFLKVFEYDLYKLNSLYEDKFLQGFTPLHKNFKDLDFKADDIEDEKIEKLVRVKRIVDFGLFVAELDINNAKLITRSEEGDKSTFEPGCMQPDPTNDLLEEMKSFNVTNVSPTAYKKSSEKKGGILKPQGSLEKSREEREQGLSESNLKQSDLSNSCSSVSIASDKKEGAKAKRAKQNVALQSIFKKLEESKQVKFSVDEVSPKERSDKLDFDPVAAASGSTPAPQYSLPVRTQSFNQNHPAFPIPPPAPQPDYLKTLRNMTTSQMNQSNFPFSKPDLPPPGMKSVPPPSSMPPPPYQNMSMFSAPNSVPHSSYSNPPMQPQSAFNSMAHQHSRPLPPYQNPGNLNPYKLKDESGAPPPNSGNSPWWPPPPHANLSQPPPFQRADAPYQMSSYAFGGGAPPFPHAQMPPPGAGGGNQAGGDMFASPWTAFGRAGGYDTGPLSFEGGGHQGPLRQGNVMKENKTMPPPMSSRSMNSHENFSQNPNTTTQGYSLFNTNSWTPNLMGQLRNTKPQDSGISLQQHSLFTSQGPQSLAQLLEQQKSQKNDL